MITFDKNGEAVNYEMIVTGTKRNCGGGKTPWNTWVTCEEIEPTGQVYEVNPYVGKSSQKKTVLGGRGGNYESFAYDSRDPKSPTFFVTNDSNFGGLLRFTPDPLEVRKALETENYETLLSSPGTSEWLVLEPELNNRWAFGGRFRWTLNRNEGDRNAKQYYSYSEGIDVRSGLVFFTCKQMNSLFILNLEDMTYTRESTRRGKFDGQPDTIARILAEDSRNEMLYFCEDGRQLCGIHARDKSGRYFSILEGQQFRGQETTGLAFSPDHKRMYVCFQDSGVMFEITRKDGYSFGADYISLR